MSDSFSFDERMAQRAARKANQKRERDAQYRADMLKLDELEQEHGDDSVRGVFTSAGMVAIRRPKKHEIDRFTEAMLRDGKPGQKASRQREAAEQLGRVCRIHPATEVYETMVEASPGLPHKVGTAAAEFAELIEEEEAGK